MNLKEPSQESSVYFHPLDHFVNEFNAGCQLQEVKLFKVTTGGWYLLCDFYPKPRLTLFKAQNGTLIASSLQKADLVGLAASSHPIGLYLKAHFKGKRLERAAFIEAQLILSFGFGFALKFHLEGKNLLVEALVPDRKPWKGHIEIASTEWAKKQDEDAASPQLSSEDRLRKKLQDDLSKAENELSWLGPIIKLLDVQKDLWAQEMNLPDDLLKEVVALQNKGTLPAFGKAQVRAANERLYNLHARNQRKVAHIRKRLQGTVLALKKKRIAATTLPARDLESRSRPKPGLWVEIQPSLWARVGRSATENDELFRQAKDRDLWFHVRSLSGGHVWIPRGQAGFKEMNLSDIIRMGCMLALFNSKARAAGAGEVDHSERRDLKKIPREAGKLKILRSKVLYVRLDPLFERKWEGK